MTSPYLAEVGWLLEDVVLWFLDATG